MQYKYSYHQEEKDFFAMKLIKFLSTEKLHKFTFDSSNNIIREILLKYSTPISVLDIAMNSMGKKHLSPLNFNYSEFLFSYVINLDELSQNLFITLLRNTYNIAYEKIETRFSDNHFQVKNKKREIFRAFNCYRKMLNITRLTKKNEITKSLKEINKYKDHFLVGSTLDSLNSKSLLNVYKNHIRKQLIAEEISLNEQPTNYKYNLHLEYLTTEEFAKMWHSSEGTEYQSCFFYYYLYDHLIQNEGYESAFKYWQNQLQSSWFEIGYSW